MNTDENTEATTAQPQSLTLAWGLQPPAGVTIAWGARAIYRLSTHEERFFENGKKRKTPKSVTTAAIDCVYQDAQGGSDEYKALSKWINTYGMKALQKRCVAEYLTGDSEDTIEHVDTERGYAIKASPRASYGYLYIVAYKTVTP